MWRCSSIMVYILSVLVYKFHYHDNRQGRIAFAVTNVVVVIINPPQGTNISYLSSSSSSPFYSLLSSYPYMYNYLSSSTSSSASLLLLIQILIRQWRHIDKSPSPSPSPWSHYWIITFGCHHLSFSTTFSAYYKGRTSLPMTFSSLLSQPIRYYSIYYNCNYDKGSGDFTGGFISQYCIS